MIKKLKYKMRVWWFKKVIYPGLRKWPAESVVLLQDTIVSQMSHAGISFANINKWLAFNKLETIKAYTMEGLNKDQMRLFYKLPDVKDRLQYPNAINHIK